MGQCQRAADQVCCFIPYRQLVQVTGEEVRSWHSLPGALAESAPPCEARSPDLRSARTADRARRPQPAAITKRNRPSNG
jgi:hypothetical protein